MRSRRTALPQSVHHLLQHAPSKTATTDVIEQIDMEMRWKFFVGLGTKIIWMMIPRMDLLNASPVPLLAFWLRKLSAQLRPPLSFIACVERTRIERAESITADALIVLQNETQGRL